MKHLLFCSKFSNSKYFDSVSPCNSPMKQVLTITVLLETGEEGLQAPVWANTGLLPEQAAASPQSPLHWNGDPPRSPRVMYLFTAQRDLQSILSGQDLFL